MKQANKDLDAQWARHHAEWREPAQIATQWEEAARTDPALLRSVVRGGWWDLLAGMKITLLVTREYEHLVMALGTHKDRPRTSFLRMPHPSGLTVDRSRNVVHIASTRNPNQVYDLAPASMAMTRLDVKDCPTEGAPLVPVQSRYFPGCVYMHDLAMIGGRLYANAVGLNAVLRLDPLSLEPVWWPRCIDTPEGPVFGQNHLQLNSIAAGRTLRDSFFSASAEVIGARRPGHRHFPVDRRGVIFSGRTREALVRGLTRPHSARLHEDQIWVDNSGYGEVGYSRGAEFQPVAKLPGWTRGLCFHENVAFVGVSRVIPRFRNYAPGLEVESSRCGVYAIDVKSGAVLGSIEWPEGNQIFAIDWMPAAVSGGFPFVAGRSVHQSNLEKKLFYAALTGPIKKGNE